MNYATKGNKKPTSTLTYIFAVVAIVVISVVTWRQMYQGLDAEKAAAIEQQKDSEQQIKDGTYQYARKWGPPPRSPSASSNEGTSSSNESTSEIAKGHENEETSSDESSTPETISSKKETD